MVNALEKLGTWDAFHFLQGVTMNSSMNKNILKHQCAIAMARDRETRTSHIIDFTHNYKTIILSKQENTHQHLLSSLEHYLCPKFKHHWETLVIIGAWI